MAEPWSGQFLQALPATVLGTLGTLGSEFLREWETQDMRVTLFKVLLLWLVLSLLGIQLAWGFYGNTVTGLYHRPDHNPHLSIIALELFLKTLTGQYYRSLPAQPQSLSNCTRGP
ncbi:T-cell leukemia translocation-altered gene protein isoform X4 [Meriones unguiculatus]|uniref:T-cell leukemia translocation-altered gene protein isoform X4 n=1 Tax=Meriones unguiculatus TaxID=10047 RepID=UPI00293E0DB0|nr:T-cell leukemia translocation-altered gene protein isoform X4 [Meriones unguiculatus]